MNVWTVCSWLSRSPAARLRRHRRTTIARRSPDSGCLPVLTTGAGTAPLLRDDLPLCGCARHSANLRARWVTLSPLLATPLRAGTFFRQRPYSGQRGHASRERGPSSVACRPTSPSVPVRHRTCDQANRPTTQSGRPSFSSRAAATAEVAFLTVAYTACHSSSSNATSQGRSGHSRPSIITYMIRQATIMHRRKVGLEPLRPLQLRFLDLAAGFENPEINLDLPSTCIIIND